MLLRNSMWKEEIQLERWERAFGYRDVGSADERAREIENIFQKGVPLLDNYAPNMKYEEKVFIEGILTNVISSIEESNGKMRAFNYSLKDK